MKILLVSMNSIHFVRWTEQLKNSGHEICWFDILDSGGSKKLSWVEQIVGWKLKYPNLKGRSRLKRISPKLYRLLSPLIENNTSKAFEKVLHEFQPDVVHSIVLYISCVPILKVMQKYHSLPWIYSSWGSDLYYFKEKKGFRKDIKAVLPRVNYLITDCKRDVHIAHELGFKGTTLGTFPGGGGYDFSKFNKYVKALAERRTILVKGYQGRSGRAIPVLKALITMKAVLQNYKIIVFGADPEVIKFADKHALDQQLNISVLSRKRFLPHKEMMKLMGEALIYIGNSNSDGMPNTLLEAVIMGAYPIQSNPGGATAEIITHKENGLLIANCEDADEIKSLILQALNNTAMIENAFSINQNEIKPKYEISAVRNQVLQKYNEVFEKITHDEAL